MVKEKPEIADESGDKYKYGFGTHEICYHEYEEDGRGAGCIAGLYPIVTGGCAVFVLYCKKALRTHFECGALFCLLCIMCF